MEKRDIQINYDLLKILLSKLNIYMNALLAMDKAMDKVNSVIADDDSKSICQLNKKNKKVKKRLRKSISEVYTLYESLDSYVNDMTAIIKPLKGLTRVGRNDIYINLQTIFYNISEISMLRGSLLPETMMTNSISDEDKQKMQRNYQMFYDRIQGDILQSLSEDMRVYKDTLKNDFYKKIVKYENEDDKHCWKTIAIRQMLSNPLDRLKQNTIDQVAFIRDVVEGAKMAVIDMVEGLASLGQIVYYGWKADVAALVDAVETDPPDWVKEAFRDYDRYVYPLTEILDNPIAVVESMAQQASDTYEKKGGAYIGGYLIADYLLGKAVKEVTKVDGPSTEGGKNFDVVEIEISRKKYPESAKHIEDAIADGKPDVLTIDRANARANRKASLKGIDKVPGKDLDEYPPAMFMEGGSGASVRPINPSDNRGAGSAFGHQLRQYPNGTKIRMNITDD